MNSLTSPFLSIIDRAGRRNLTALPGLLAASVRDEIDDLPAVRPHQRVPLHAFLSQVGALALLAIGCSAPPDDEVDWAAALRKLTPGYLDDEPWTLIVEDMKKPALLQPPIPEGRIDVLKDRELTPDALDYLVTSKNHDVKAARMAQATLEHWFLALVTLQTMEGFLGATNYGVSRMNGGFASRPLVGLAPDGGIGARLTRDIRRLIDLRLDEPETDAYAGYQKAGGVALLWLQPWDGIAQLSPSSLDPYYVEICRRVRLVMENGRVVARRAGSKAARIMSPKEANGVTGDPFAPIDLTDAKKGHKPLTVSAGGFDYRLVSQIISRDKFEPAPLQVWRQDDGTSGLSIVFSALARGQGETNGLHERRVPIPSGRVSLFGQPDDPFAKLAKERVDDASDVRRRALRFALFVLFQNAPKALDPRHTPSESKAEAFLSAFDRAVDAVFFPSLEEELSAPDDAVRAGARIVWLEKLRSVAHSVLENAAQSVPLSSLRHYTTLQAARDALNRSFDKHFAPLASEAS
jgi:CRISPR system Cascade subunit CasA